MWVGLLAQNFPSIGAIDQAYRQIRNTSRILDVAHVNGTHVRAVSTPIRVFVVGYAPAV